MLAVVDVILIQEISVLCHLHEREICQSQEYLPFLDIEPLMDSEHESAKMEEQWGRLVLRYPSNEEILLLVSVKVNG